MTSRPPSYGQNNNQNFFVPDGKTSSRVLQAPGGSSSISLSWDDDEKIGKRTDEDVSIQTFSCWENCLTQPSTIISIMSMCIK